MKTLINIDWDNQSIYVKESGIKASPRLSFTIKSSGLIIKGIDMSLLLPDDRTATVVVNAVDAKGFPAVVENVVFSSSDETVVIVDANGVISPVGIGSAQVNVTADALIGEGEVLLAGILDVQVVAGQAVGLNVTAVIN